MKKHGNKARNGDDTYDIVWDIKALNAVESIYKYILQKSLQGAETVKKEIFAAIDSLQTYPERFPVDRDIKSPYRRCLVRNYKIIFRIYNERKQILIIHIWNSKRSTESLLKEIARSSPKHK
jgi:plasmid stabilization system protein ParE